MRWQNREQSKNVEDHRGRRAKKVGGGIGIVAIIFAVINKNEDILAKFVGTVLKDTEDVWTKLFREKFNKRYVKPKLVIYSGQDESGCGYAQSTTGPFYCPADQKIYIDLSFYNELQYRFHAPGDFAMAYIIAHEVGHHVQNLMGISQQVEQRKRRMNEVEGNKLSVRLELQADFLAGVWAHHDHKMYNILEKGDIDEAINAASAVGDDKIQMQARGYVVPDAFTHGTSAQRIRWFKKGLKSGDLSEADTFGANNL